jgi:hypothetical protein
MSRLPHLRLATSSIGLTLLLTALFLSHATFAQELVPAPNKAFTTRTALAFYADLATASRSAIWQTLESKLEPLASQWQSIPGLQSPIPAQLDSLHGIESDDIAELVVVVQGERALENLESAQFDPDFGILTIIRLTKTVDLEETIRKALDSVETTKPGLSQKIEQSRTRVSGAEFFDLPAELFDESSMPFPVSAAAGQGAGGSVFGFGKSETLRAFLSGRTDGNLPPGIATSLARRDQIWLYLPFSGETLRNASAGNLENNPVVATLAKSLEKVNELGLGLSFGSTKVNFELTLGCTDSAAARELTQGLQQFIGLMQMSNQNSANTPPFLGKLKAASDGLAFRLSTELVTRDFDMLLKNISPTTTSSPRPATKVMPAPGPAKERKTAPATVQFLELLPGDLQSLRYTRLQIDNRSNQPIREIRVTFNYHDQSGRRIGQWTRRHQDPNSDVLVPAESNREVRSPTFHVPAATRRVTLVLHEITFADGTKWVPDSIR